MDSRIKSTDSLWSTAARVYARQAERNDEASAAAAQEQTEKAQEETGSVRVVLSEDALERAAKAREALTQLTAVSAQSDKDAARAKLAEIKQRIKMLKMMLSMVGPAAAKGIIAELRQLAGQLSQAAATLQSGSGAGGGVSVAPMTTPAVQGAGSSANQDAAGAGAAAQDSETAAAADRDNGKDAAQEGQDASNRVDATVSASQERLREARQRQADARAVNELVRELKALLAAAQRKLREQGDKDAPKTQDIDAALSDAEQSAREMSAGMAPAPAAMTAAPAATT